MDCEIETETLDGGRVRKVAFAADGEALSYADALACWRDDEAFRDLFLSALRDAPFDAYFWETPPITRESAERAFEFVVVDAPELARMAAEPAAFAMYFSTGSGPPEVSAFWNLGRDALLVAPGYAETGGVYRHLAEFIRSAPPDHVHAFWRLVGEKAAERLADKPLWVSTSGFGIAWLHVRLDSFPKYYTYAPYRSVP